MPGLYGICFKSSRPEELQKRVLEGLTFSERYAKAETVNPYGFAGVLHHGRIAHGVECVEDEVQLLVDGWIFSFDGCRMGDDALRQLIKFYRERGLKSLLEGVNGQFNLFLHDLRTSEFYVASDSAGSRQLYYYYDESNGDFAFAPEIKAILAAVGREPVLNEDQLYNQLTFSRLRMGDETFFRGVHAFKPGMIHKWTAGKLDRELWWSWRYTTANGDRDEIVARGIHLFREVLGDISSFAGDRLGMMLSGGLDSRLVMAGLESDKRRIVRCFTLGAGSDHYEVEVARRAAATCHSPWELIKLTPSDFVKRGAEGNRILEGMDLMTQSYGLEAFGNIGNQVDVFINGFILDVVLGGSYLCGEVVDSPLDHDLGRAYLLNKFAYFKQSEFTELCADKDAATHWERQQETLLSLYASSENELSPDRIDEIVFYYRSWRYLIPRQYWLRLFFDEITPALDARLLKFFLSIPVRFRRDYSLYQDILIGLSGELADLEYANTTLPASAPVSCWREAAQLEANREKLYRKIYHKTGGGQFIPYKQYYSNFDEWLRMDPDWIQTTDDLLLSDDSILCQKYVRPEYVQRLLREHRCAQTTHYSKIIQLMTLEMTLRNFFN